MNLLKRILRRLLGLRLPFRLQAKPASIPPEAASVRQIYRQLLRWAATGGYPRHAAQTPNEYLYALAGLLPEAQEDLGFITHQYVRTRYGASPPSDEDLRRLARTWQQVKQNQLKHVDIAHTQE